MQCECSCKFHTILSPGEREGRRRQGEADCFRHASMKQLWHCISQTHKWLQQSITQVSVPSHSHPKFNRFFFLHTLNTFMVWNKFQTKSAQIWRTDRKITTNCWDKNALQRRRWGGDGEIKWVHKEADRQDKVTLSGDADQGHWLELYYTQHTHTRDETLLMLVSEHSTPLTSSLDS